MYEAQIVKDGDPAFGIEGTFQIHNKIYVLTDEADDRLLLHVADLGYRINDTIKPHRDDLYAAEQPHAKTKDEISAEFINSAGHATDQHSTYFVDMQYKDRQRFSLTDQFIHDQIIVSSSQRRDLEYYNRSHDQMSDIAISRMSGFVKNMVDVDFKLWEEFVEESRHYHAQDFIRRMAHWASQKSDRTPRTVRIDPQFNSEIVLGAEEFNLKKPLPIGGLRGGPFFRR